MLAPGLALTLTLLFPAAASAAVPNDTCAGAVQIPGSGPFPHSTSLINVTDATITGDPPVPVFYTNLLGRSVWFRFTPAANALYTISTCAGVTGSTMVDTVMGLYTSAGGCSGPFVQVAFEDENCNSQAEISSQLLADTTYYVVVWKYDDGSPDDGLNTLQLRVTGLVAPPNDRCESARPVLLNVPAFGTTSGAEDHYRIDAPAAFVGLEQTPSSAPGRDVVYTFTAPQAGPYSIKVWNSDVSEDVVIYAATATACPTGPFPALVSGVLAASNRSRVNSAEEISCLELTAGQAIRIFVDHGQAGSTGSSFILEVTRCQSEVETNNTPETASKIACGILGSIDTPGDLDFYALGSFPPDWRAFVLVDGESSRNSDLDLRIVSNTATIEFDDNNNDTTYGDSSPNIAGAVLAGGPAYVLVNYNGFLDAQPYRLYAVVQPPPASSQPESEPNDAPDQANTGVVNYYRGVLTGPAPSTDVDVFAFNVDEGDLFFVSLDADPSRNNTPINARLELVDQSGNILITANDGAFSSSTNQSPDQITAFTPFSPAEGFVYRFAEEGTFYARVSISPTAVGTAGAGDYLLSVSRNCRTGQGLGNNAPVLIGLSTDSPRPEGQAITLNGVAAETDLSDSFRTIVFWGDGTSNVVDLATGGGVNLHQTHAYPPDTTANTDVVNYQISVVARDNLGGTVISNLTASIQNVRPEDIVLTPSSLVLPPQQPLTLSGTFTDPGVTDAHSVSINWGDGTALQSFNLAVGVLQFSSNHSYAITETNVTISVTVTDDDQGSNTTTTSVRLGLPAEPARFAAIIPAAGPSFRLRLTGTPGATYRVEKANTFGNWSELGVQTADAAGAFEVVDTNPDASSRFYRAVSVP